MFWFSGPQGQVGEGVRFMGHVVWFGLLYHRGRLVRVSRDL